MITGKSSGPISRFYFSQRLRLHYVDWGNEDAPPLLLVHGGRDHCRSWDWVAEALSHDFHVIAPDLRGHGDSAWAPGGSYGMTDFVYDLAHLIRQKHLEPLSIISHSMGGFVSLLYSGLFPQTVTRLIAIEGTVFDELRPVEERITTWIEQLRDLSGRRQRKYDTLEEALHRMQVENPNLSDEQARHLTVHGVNQNEDGTFSWKFDNYVRAFSPARLSPDEVTQLWSRITAPTLLIRGMQSWLKPPETTGAMQHFKSALTINIAGAGHWPHHDQLDEFLTATRAFLAGIT
jgi:pimeloyl-ACP methyl ester carboxylesterase